MTPPYGAWLIELVTLGHPEREELSAAMMAGLARTAFSGRKFKFHALDVQTAKREVREVGG